MIRLAYWPRWRIAALCVAVFVTAYAWVGVAADAPESQFVDHSTDPIQVTLP